MLPKVNRILFSCLFFVIISTTILAQAPTSADVMRERISKAKAHLVVKNYSAAIYELENIKRETNDRAIQMALNVLLMHAYLEQGDYKRTQAFLNELFKDRSPNAAADYIAVAAQVVSGAKTQLRRYEVVGLNVSDEKLPSYAVEDLDQMRTTLELIIDQSKFLGKDKKFAANSLALLEEASASRAKISRDGFDAKRWENEITYARQQIVTSGSRVINAVDDSPINSPDIEIVAVNEKYIDAVALKETAASTSPPITEDLPAKPLPIKEKKVETPKGALPENAVAKADIPKVQPLSGSPLPSDKRIRIIGSAEKTEPKPSETEPTKKESKEESTASIRKGEAISSTSASVSEENDDGSPLTVGSLIGYATKRVTPVYPRQAKNMRMTGVVKVEVTIDEDGNVSNVDNADGPALLQRAARDAAVKWRFRPFTRFGQPVKATGFVSFNFNL